MSFMVPLALWGFLPLGISLFWYLPLRKAILTGYLIGWLFLPQAGFALPGVPDYTRMTAVNLTMFLGVALRDPAGLFRGRLRIWDLAMIVWCLHVIPTSITNGLGVYDGLSAALDQFFTWGIPYWIGRSYFSDESSIRSLAIAVFVGGLICVPLCIWEMRMSPNLHHAVYGFHPTKTVIAARLGGYRPMLFMQHGIAVGLWMCAAALVGLWLWRSRALRALFGTSVGWMALLLLVTAIFCRSMNAILLLALAIGTLVGARMLRLRSLLLLFVLLPVIYVSLRAPRIWHPQKLVAFITDFDAARGSSFEARVEQEEKLLAKAWQRPALGWGTYGRNRVIDPETGRQVTTDSLWIITFGQGGLVGLLSLGLVLTLPGLLLWRRYRLADWWSAAGASAGALAIVVTMYAADCLMNAMLNPIFHMAAGAVIGFAIRLGDQRQLGANVPADLSRRRDHA